MPLAILPARPVVEKALPAMLDAWLNLSQREKARELVMVRAIAIADHKNSQRAISYTRQHLGKKREEKHDGVLACSPLLLTYRREAAR